MHLKFLARGTGSAAARAGASAVGIERREPLVVRATDNARMAGVAARATFPARRRAPVAVGGLASHRRHGFSRRTGSTCSFLGSRAFSAAAPGSHTWPAPGWRPSRVVLVENAAGRPWPIYLYRVPATDEYAPSRIGGS